jgi:dihydropteroate synthase
MIPALTGFAPFPDPTSRLYLRPVGLLPAADAPGAWRLAGGRLAFTLAELIVRDGPEIRRVVAPVSDILSWSQAAGKAVARRLEELLAALSRPRPPLAGLSLDRPRLMAVLNVTPDSFSDGGAFLEPAMAIPRGEALLAAGADIVDIGGESTRPGAAEVPADQELARVLPVISALAARGARLSIDTRHARVMDGALAAGATLINDITGLTGDADSLPLVAARAAPVVLMHIQGEPGTMQEAPHYIDAALDVYDWLEARVTACRAAGIPLERIAVDPGIGFGKTVAHNLQCLRHLSLFHGLGAALLVGVSRKRFIATLSRGEPPTARLPGTLAASLDALSQGAQLLRIHDPDAFVQARAVWEGLHPAA